MNQPFVRLCLVLHNHQPIGNFDNVFEQAYRDSYLPFLDVLADYPQLRISLHTSGPLMEWLDQHHSDYLDRLGQLAAEDRVEILGGAFYEPILSMIPQSDRIGQITQFTQWLENRLSGRVQGMWMPERVWEQSMTADLAAADIRYTVLDDFHFRNAGLTDSQLDGCYITESEGRVLSVFPGCERLRYVIPFADPEESITFLRGAAERRPGAVMVFGDDGEKFGAWPQTHKHVYQDGWLRRFFDALAENQDWLRTCTLAEAAETAPPLGKIYLPDASYREMTEWALPVNRQTEYEVARRKLQETDCWDIVQPFVRGGYWRNFKAKYSETNDMYARMMMISRRLRQLQKNAESNTEPNTGLNTQSTSKSALLDPAPARDLLHLAQRELYRGQCNCSYWHGAFGGVYLPHLRRAVYSHLIAADNLLDRASGKAAAWVEATAEDYNFDARPEVRLANEKLVCLLTPAGGGQLYELDVRAARHNLLATMTRREEVYHQQILGDSADGAVAAIHEQNSAKQEGLDRRIQYDAYLRRALIDHFYDDEVTLNAIASGGAMERGDFVGGNYETVIRRNPDRVQVVLTRSGNAWGIPIKITKGVTLTAGQPSLEIAYQLEGVPQDRTLHFAVEFNFAGLPAGADDRFFHHGDISLHGDKAKLGHLGERLDLHNQQHLSLTDQWLGLSVHLAMNQACGLWTHPIETVSQSEGGYELVHQSTTVIPHWLIRGDENGRWSVTLRLAAETAADQQENSEPVAEQNQPVLTERQHKETKPHFELKAGEPSARVS